MYGTVARMRTKPGSQQLVEQLRGQGEGGLRGHLGTFIYRSDADPDEYFVCVFFESKEAYVANADSPEQDARYRELRALLAEDPEWHDGEVVFHQSALTPTR